jgi:hypothetical protein
MASLMLAALAARLTISLTARSVSRPPCLRLANTGSLAPASPRSDNNERLTDRRQQHLVHLADIASD